MFKHGKLHLYGSEELIQSSDEQDGFFVVISGLVKVNYKDPSGIRHQYFLGAGTVLPCTCM